MPTPNLFLTYVSDAAAAARFYGDLFEMEPVFTSPRYVAFRVAPDVLFAVWTGAGKPDPASPRFSEVGLMVPSGADVDAYFARWTAKGVTVVEEPHDDVFGRTFVVADPDGNLIRVSPTD
jgi:predicted enzyme related to lactoylglutathione lyase